MTTLLKWFIFVLFEISLLSGLCGGNTGNVLQIVWMVPSQSHRHTNFIYNASTSVAALALGLKTVERENILPGHVLK